MYLELISEISLKDIKDTVVNALTPSEEEKKAMAIKRENDKAEEALRQQAYHAKKVADKTEQINKINSKAKRLSDKEDTLAQKVSYMDKTMDKTKKQLKEKTERQMSGVNSELLKHKTAYDRAAYNLKKDPDNERLKEKVDKLKDEYDKYKMSTELYKDKIQQKTNKTIDKMENKRNRVEKKRYNTQISIDRKSKKANKIARKYNIDNRKFDPTINKKNSTPESGSKQQKGLKPAPRYA